MSSYCDAIVALGQGMTNLASRLKALREERSYWASDKRSIHLGRDSILAHAPAAGQVKAAMIAAHDAAIIATENQLEGLRYRMANLGKRHEQT